MVAVDTLVCRVSFPVPEDRSHFPGASISARAVFGCGGMGATLEGHLSGWALGVGSPQGNAGA